jgi:hypothetical protein
MVGGIETGAKVSSGWFGSEVECRGMEELRTHSDTLASHWLARTCRRHSAPAYAFSVIVVSGWRLTVPVLTNLPVIALR